LNIREYVTLVPLVILAFWIGIYPKPLFNVLDVPVRQIVQQVNPGYFDAQQAGEPAEEAEPPAAEAPAAVLPAPGADGVAANESPRTSPVAVAAAAER
jgi:NADH-quinone oxidoreductase subunit M